MLTKPQFFYDHTTKQALGFQNPFYLKKAQQLEPKLYDGNVIKNTKKKVNTTPVDYAVLNQLSQDFETRFVPQTELSAEQAFWSQNSVNSPEPTLSSRPTKVEVPKELPKVSMVNTSLKKLKHHLAGFDVVVKERTTATAITEGSWGLQEKVLVITALKDDLRKLKGKDLVDNTVTKHIIDPEMLKIDVGPITPKLLNKRTTHSAYIKHTQKEAVVLRDLVDHVETNYPLDHSLESACRHTKLIQELLTNISKTYPSINNSGVKPSTSASGSQPSSNTKKDKIQQTPSSTQKNKVEAHPWKDKSSLKNKDFVIAPKGTTKVQHSKLNANSELKFVKCNGCMLSVNHDLYVLDFINNVNARRPTGQTFTIVGNACPLTRITTTTEVPLRKPTVLDNEIPKPVVTLVYSRKPRKSKTNVPVSKSKVLKSVSTNKKEPSQSWGSIVSDVPSSPLDESKESIKDWDQKSVYSVSWRYVGILSYMSLVKGLKVKVLAMAPILKATMYMILACAMDKIKKKPHKPKSEDTNQEKLYLFHMDLCGPMRVTSVNGKKYILVIVNDYTRFTWVKCLRSKDEAPDFIIKFLKMIQVWLKVSVRRIRTDNGTEFVNQTLHKYYEKVDISHETYVARSPQQNGVVERRNRMLIEAARTMLIYAKAPLFLWAEAVATACYTQNHSTIRLRHGKTPNELLHDKPPDLSFFHVFGALCYLTNNSENLDFDELTTMASEHSSSGPALHEMTPATISSRLVPNPPLSIPLIPPSRTDWDLLFQLLFNELLNPPSSVDNPAPKVIAPIAEVVASEPAASTEDNHDLDVAHMNNDLFFSILIPENDSKASSSSDIIPTVVHTATPNSEPVTKWTKDYPLENFIDELERPVSIRLQLHEQALFCYYDAFLTSVEPKNYKDALTQACWIEAMQEELHEFKHLEVWELVPRLDKVMVITLKWIYKVKLDEMGGILKNKARLVARGYRQEEEF
ncbi:retrovirus-related pol polyprotein from transposon TNT 1-94 [Tanacetum coccineum]